MKSDEKRSHRLNYLLKCYLVNPTENDLYQRAKQMGVTDTTAKITFEQSLFKPKKFIQSRFFVYIQKLTLISSSKDSFEILNKEFINNQYGRKYT